MGLASHLQHEVVLGAGEDLTLTLTLTLALALTLTCSTRSSLARVKTRSTPSAKPAARVRACLSTACPAQVTHVAAAPKRRAYSSALPT